MRFPSAVRRDPGIDAWFAAHDEQRWAAQPWFERMRACGADVRELMHDHCPTACVEDAAFAYVGAYAAHVSVGFFNGSALKDPAGLLEGAGKRMRHVKIRTARLAAATRSDLSRLVREGWLAGVESVAQLHRSRSAR